MRHFGFPFNGFYGIPPTNGIQAVAVGAAVQGHILAAGDARTGGADLAGSTDLLLLDVTPLSLGIELEGREMSVLIKRNTTIPCRKSRSYTTVEDWQTSIDVVVYEVGPSSAILINIAEMALSER